MLIFFFFAIAIVIFMFVQASGREGRIEEEIRSMGGQVISIERRNFFTGLGPFMVVGKGRVVYRIEYRVGNEVKEGWVRFGGLFGPDWRF